MGALNMVRLGIIIIVAFTGSLSALPPSSPVPAERAAVTIAWETKQRTLADGRTFYARVPTCSPARSSDCQSYLGRERDVILVLHAAAAAEDAETASRVLLAYHSLSRDTIFVFGVSKDGTRRWDAGLCCTTQRVDDVGYLARVVNNLDARWAVDRQRVGATGFSNGGMLAIRATCERPDLFAAVAALGATYDAPCNVGRTRIGQWHGGRDASVPLNGGTVKVNGIERTFPPVASLAQRMAPGSIYELHVLPNRAHDMSWTQYRQSIRWLVAHLPD